jgi:vacuolar protein sorting-associated protein 13A/C
VTDYIDLVAEYTLGLFIINLLFDFTGDTVGFFSAPLNQIAGNIKESSHQFDYLNYLTWIDLSSSNSMVNAAFHILIFSFLLLVLWKLS